MNRKLLTVIIVLITLTLGCSEVLAGSPGASYLAKWKGDAKAAFSTTFDDNGAMHNIQASILEEYGVRGTFGPITSYMNEEMFLDIFHRGHELGSHTVNHLPLNEASMETIIYELTESKLFIEELTGVPCVSYIAPYGKLDPNVIAVAWELYISARGVHFGINGVAGADIFKLWVAPYPTPWGSTWTDEQYITNLRQYVEDVLEVEGWGVEMWHGLTLEPNFPSSGQTVNETVFRSHLAELTSEYAQVVWVAPQGKVARYHLEWQETTINTWPITDYIILVDLLFDGDKEIFDEPLTVVTRIPENWVNGQITVMQDGTQLDYMIDVCDEVPCLLYDALPGAGAVSIVLELILGDLNGDGVVDMIDLARLSAHWLEGVE